MSALYRYRRFVLSHLHRYNKHKRFLACSSRNSQEASLEGHKNASDEIVIPRRIHRSPTALLEALASTVKRDAYSPPYHYIDDPEVLPISSQEKKSFALAMSSGRRAAKHAMKKWPQNFSANPMDPSLEIPDAFKVYNGSEHAEDTIEHLEEMIDLHRVEQAYISYQKLKEAGTSVSSDIQEDLLDLLCVYNSKDHEPLMDEENLYSRVITQDSSRQSMKNTWNDNGPAETVFYDMEIRSLRAYCSMIKGMAKHFQVEKAILLYKEMTQKQMIPDMNTYYGVLRVACLAQNQLDGKIQMIKEIFREIKNKGFQPTVSLFIVAFEAVTFAHISQLRNSARFMSSLLSEMYACGLEPTPAIWYHVLRIVYRDNECNNGAIHEIINRLEGKELIAQYPDDLEFFSTAMVKAQRNLNNLELGYRIDDLLNTEHNYNLLGSNYLEGLYYNFFFKLLCTFDDMDTIMEYYHKAVPHWYTPTFTTINEFTEAIQLNEGYKYLPEIWSDMFFFRYHRYPNMMVEICRLAAKPRHQEPLLSQLHNLCEVLYKEIKFTVMMAEEKGFLITDDTIKIVSAELLGYMWQISLNANDIQTAKEMYGFFQDYKAKIQGQLPEKTMENLVDVFIAEKDFTNSVDLLQVMVDYSYKCIDRTVEKIKSLMDLTPDQIEIVNDIIK